VLPCFARAIQAGLDTGDVQYVSYACSNGFAAGLVLWDELREAEQQLERFAGIIQRTREATGVAFMAAGRQFIKNLTGRTRSRLSLSDDGCDEHELARVVDAPGFVVVACFYYVIRLQVMFLHGDYESALAALDIAEQKGVSSAGMFFTTEMSSAGRGQRAAPAASKASGAPEQDRAMERGVPGELPPQAAPRGRGDGRRRRRRSHRHCALR
jgi:predicted ATPase